MRPGHIPFTDLARYFTVRGASLSELSVLQASISSRASGHSSSRSHWPSPSKYPSAIRFPLLRVQMHGSATILPALDGQSDFKAHSFAESVRP